MFRTDCKKDLILGTWAAGQQNSRLNMCFHYHTVRCLLLAFSGVYLLLQEFKIYQSRENSAGTSITHRSHFCP